MKRIMILALAASFTIPVFAAPETYIIDSSHTFPNFSYTHFGFSTQQSKFDKTSGKIIIDRVAKSGQSGDWDKHGFGPRRVVTSAVPNRAMFWRNV